MSTRTNAIVIALATLAIPAAFAQSAYINGETGWVVAAPVQSTLTREQVRNEFFAFRSNPVVADGSRYVGGQQGYVNEAHSFARVYGQWVCTDKIAHNAAPTPIKTPDEQWMFRQQQG